MQINRADITALLRSRGQSDRADWVDRTLPEQVDSHVNSALLKMLEIDPAKLERSSEVITPAPEQ